MSAEVLPLRRKKWQAVPGCPFLKLHIPSGVYYVRKYKARRGELFASTGERTKGRARSKAEAMIEEWLGTRRKPTARPNVERVTEELEEALEQEFLNKQRRPKTWSHDQDYLPIIRRHFGKEHVDAIDEEFWESWVRTEGKGLGRATLFDIAKYLSKTLTFAYSRKYIDRKPRIKNPDRAKKTGRVYTDEEIAAMVKAADQKTLAQIALGYECGLRSYEVRCLKRDWIRVDQGRAVLTLPEEFVKSNAREIVLSEGAAKLVREVVQGESPFVFPSPLDPKEKCESAVYQNRRWRRVVRAAGIEGDRPWFRYLRHSFYNKVLLELGLPVQQVSQYGGTSIRTLQRHYLMPSADRTAQVAKAVKLPGTRGKFVDKGGK